MICICGGDLRGQGPGVIGTRDGFGIGKEFIDERTGKTIDNYRAWEKAGYKDVSAIQNHEVKERVKEKVKSLKGKPSKKLEHTSLPM